MTTDADVNKDEAEESSTSAVPDVKTEATESSTDASAEVTGSQTSESETPDQAIAPTREALIAQLTGKDKTLPEKTDEVDSDEETEVETDTATEAPAKEDESDLTDEDINAPLGKEGTKGARERIQSLLKQRKDRDTAIEEMKVPAEFGKNLMDVAREGNITPDQLGAWIAFAAETNKDPSKAALRFQAEAERLAKAHNVSLPVKVDHVIPKELDEIEEMLINDALEGNIPAEVVKKYREKVRTAKAGKTPAPAVPPAQSTQPALPTQTPTDPMKDPAVVKATQDLQSIQVELAKKYPADWAKAAPVIQSRLARYRGVDPAQWAALYREEADKVLKPASTVRSTPSTNQPLRPTTQPTVATAKPKTGKAAAIGILTGRIK